MNVRAIIEAKGSEIITISADVSLHEVARILSRRRVGALVVVSEDGKPAGIISERDLINAVAEKGADVLRMPANEFITRKLKVCGLDDGLDDVMQTMTDKRIRHLPVMDGERLIGIISIGDVVKWRIEASDREAKLLRDYIASG